MTTTKDKLAQLRQAYKSGILDESTYEAVLKGLGIDIKDANESDARS